MYTIHMILYTCIGNCSKQIIIHKCEYRASLGWLGSLEILDPLDEAWEMGLGPIPIDYKIFFKGVGIPPTSMT